LRRPIPRWAIWSSPPTYPSSPRIIWSPPEQKASGPSPHKTMTPTSGLSRARVKASVSSKSVWGRKALRRSGRQMVQLGHAFGHFVADVGEGSLFLPFGGRKRPKVVKGIMGAAGDHGMHGALRYCQCLNSLHWTYQGERASSMPCAPYGIPVTPPLRSTHGCRARPPGAPRGLAPHPGRGIRWRVPSPGRRTRDRGGRRAGGGHERFLG